MTNRYTVREVDDAYKYQLVEDLGHDCQQVGDVHMYKVIAHFTYKPVADYLAKQMNKYGVLYIPGDCGWHITGNETA